jgi:hypothetical protein
MDDVRTKRQVELGVRRADKTAKAVDMEIEMENLYGSKGKFD